MSTLSQFAPFASGGLKSFQTGFVSTSSISSGGALSEDSRFVDASISSVNTAKAIPGFDGAFYQLGVQGPSYQGNGIHAIVFPRLVSATVIRLGTTYSGDLSSPQISGRWQVAEAN
jgi:hypothetical protein